MARVIKSFRMMHRFSGDVAELHTIVQVKDKFDISEEISINNIDVVAESANTKNKFVDTIQTVHDMRFLTNEKIEVNNFILYNNIKYKIIEAVELLRDDFNIYLGVKTGRI